MTRQAEVCELDHYIGEDKDVACSDIAMYDLVFALQVVKRAAYLLSEHEERADGEGAATPV